MVSLFLAGLAGSLGAWAAERSTEGLLALYDFSLVKGGSVKDRSGVGQPLDLRIENLRNVRRAEGSLEVRGQTLIRSDKPATKIIEAVRRTGEFTVEAWLRTGRLNQDGPARIVTISRTVRIEILHLAKRATNLMCASGRRIPATMASHR